MRKRFNGCGESVRLPGWLYRTHDKLRKVKEAAWFGNSLHSKEIKGLSPSAPHNHVTALSFRFIQIWSSKCPRLHWCVIWISELFDRFLSLVTDSMQGGYQTPTEICVSETALTHSLQKHKFFFLHHHFSLPDCGLLTAPARHLKLDSVSHWTWICPGICPSGPSGIFRTMKPYKHLCNMGWMPMVCGHISAKSSRGNFVNEKLIFKHSWRRKNCSELKIRPLKCPWFLQIRNFCFFRFKSFWDAIVLFAGDERGGYLGGQTMKKNR